MTWRFRISSRASKFPIPPRVTKHKSSISRKDDGTGFLGATELPFPSRFGRRFFLPGRPFGSAQKENGAKEIRGSNKWIEVAPIRLPRWREVTLLRTANIL
jgi:hypothetical protein